LGVTLTHPPQVRNSVRPDRNDTTISEQLRPESVYGNSFDAFDNNDDVQNVHHNAELTTEMAE
jgi:transcriptional/translational regulatory protein YebC/TACO1